VSSLVVLHQVRLLHKTLFLLQYNNLQIEIDEAIVVVRLPFDLQMQTQRQKVDIKLKKAFL